MAITENVAMLKVGRAPTAPSKRAAKKVKKSTEKEEKSRRQAERERVVKPPTAEELALEAELFGGEGAAEAALASHAFPQDGMIEEEAENNDLPLFFEDAEGDVGQDANQHVTEEEDEAGRAVWADDALQEQMVDIGSQNRLKKLRIMEDNEKTLISGSDYEKRLRQQYENSFGAQLWTDALTSSPADGHVFDATAGGILARRSGILSPDKLDIARRKNANLEEESKAVIQALSFHPSADILLTAGYDKTLRLFNIDGETNEKLYSLHLPDLPIGAAQFAPDGHSVIISGRRKYYYILDLPSCETIRIPALKNKEEHNLEHLTVSPCNRFYSFISKRGIIFLMDRKTRQLIGELKMNGECTATHFSADGNHLFATGKDGDIYQFDVGTRRCVHRFVDDGARNTTNMQIQGQQWLSTGGDSGIVNVYRYDQCIASTKPKPLAAIQNLTTPIRSCQFSHDGQLLAISSRARKDQLRMVHLPSMRTFANWPTASTPLSYVNTLSFSHDSRFFAVGNDKGKALLWSLKDYDL